MTRTVKKGDRIRVNYIGTLNNGEKFDSSLDPGRTPLEFIVGAGTMIKGFDRGVEGMTVGETKKLHLLPEEAYGMPRDDLFFPITPDRLPDDYKPTVGDRLVMGQGVYVYVSKVNDDGSIIIDANHGLAGQELNFEVTLVEIL